MQLVKATVSDTAGPDWATMLNTIFDRIDQHNHSSGLGVKVGVAGISIDGDLDVTIHRLVNIAAAKFSDQGGALSGINNYGSLYLNGNELYFYDGAGNTVQVTSSGALNSPLPTLVSVTGTYNVPVGTNDLMLEVDTAAARTINLHSVVGVKRRLVVTDINGTASDTNTITLVPSGSEKIAGTTGNYVMRNAYCGLILYSDGANGWVLS
jgi:hypothetical protein